MRVMTFEVSSCDESQLRYRICPMIDGIYYMPICWGDSEKAVLFICDQLNTTLVNYLREDSNILPETICELMGIKKYPKQFSS